MHIEKVKLAVANSNIKYLDGKYEGSRSKLLFICNHGHIFNRSYDSVVNLKRFKCPICNSRKFNTEYVRDVLSRDGYILLSEYKNANSPITVQCPSGHISTIYYSNYSNGHRCFECSSTKYTNSEVDTILEQNNYKRSGEYTGVFDKISAICSEGHNIELVLNDFNKGSRCPICKSSDLEIMFENEIKNLNVKYNIRDRKAIEPNELDFYFPDHAFAVELHGSRWHSDKFIDKNAHMNKYNKCKDLNINLVQIFDFEWSTRKKQIINYIKSKLGIFEKSIYARDCDIIYPSKNDVKLFIDENHIQQYAGHAEAYGLSYNGDIVAIITLNRHHRSSNQMILNRLCIKSGVNIIGGVKKLFNTIPMKSGLITHADLRFTSGDIYLDLGFKVKHINKPDYMYVKNGKMRSKQSMKKTKEERLLNKTEFELREEQGYYRVWDAGKICFIY